jgi:hypothetical protein
MDHIEVVRLDDPLEVHMHEVETRRGPPMSGQSRPDRPLFERDLAQRTGIKIDLDDRQFIGRPPVRIDVPQMLRGQDGRHDPLPGV